MALNTPDQDSRLVYVLHSNDPYPEFSKPWEWLAALLDLGKGSLVTTSTF